MVSSRHVELLGELRAAAERAAKQAGLELVDFSLRGSSRKRLLRVDIDRAGPQGVNNDDCRTVSRILDQELEERELVSGEYTLEVSSPGIDRPIESPEDIRRNTGRKIVVATREPVEGSRLVRGVLLGGDDETMTLSRESGGDLRIPLHAIEKARQDVSL